MPVRVKWYKATPIDRRNLDILLAGFIKDEYSESIRWGFSNIALRGTFIEGQYIQRRDSVVEIKDPFQRPLQFTRIDFDTLIFQIGTKFPHIELRDAPKGVGTFLNQIARYLNFTVAIEPIIVDLVGWIKAIERDVQSLMVLGAWVSDISVANDVQARMALVGSSDVRPLIKNLTGRYRYALKKIQVTGVLRSQRCKFDLFSDARASITVGVETEIFRVLKKALTDVMI